MSDEVTRQAVEAQADRNVRRDDYDWMVRERDDWQKRAGGFEREAQMITAILHRLTAERDAARAEVDQLTAERDAARADLAIVRVKRNESQAERDAALADLCQAEENNHGLMIEVQNMRAGVALAAEERDAAERERTESRAEVVRLRVECEGLRADLLAHPPELHQELAIERKRHLELMEDYDRQNVMIGILEDAVKRAENALKVAQAKRVNPRITGYAATIAQLASQIEDLLS